MVQAGGRRHKASDWSRGWRRHIRNRSRSWGLSREPGNRTGPACTAGTWWREPWAIGRSCRWYGRLFAFRIENDGPVFPMKTVRPVVYLAYGVGRIPGGWNIDYEEIRPLKQSGKSTVHLVQEKGGKQVYVRKRLKGRRRTPGCWGPGASPRRISGRTSMPWG